METLPVGYILQHKVPSASSSGKLDFIVCEAKSVKCYRMVDSILYMYRITGLQDLYPVTYRVRRLLMLMR